MCTPFTIIIPGAIVRTWLLARFFPPSADLSACSTPRTSPLARAGRVHRELGRLPRAHERPHEQQQQPPQRRRRRARRRGRGRRPRSERRRARRRRRRRRRAAVAARQRPSVDQGGAGARFLRDAVLHPESLSRSQRTPESHAAALWLAQRRLFERWEAALRDGGLTDTRKIARLRTLLARAAPSRREVGSDVMWHTRMDRSSLHNDESLSRAEVGALQAALSALCRASSGRGPRGRDGASAAGPGEGPDPSSALPPAGASS